MKDGRPADGFVAAIGQCGAVLAEHVPPGALQRDGSPDRLLETWAVSSIKTSRQDEPGVPE